MHTYADRQSLTNSWADCSGPKALTTADPGGSLKTSHMGGHIS